MFENLSIVAAIAIVLWLGLIAFYTISSRQQQKIEQDLHSLEQMLQDDAQQDDA